jgi:hypothetical protein
MMKCYHWNLFPDWRIAEMITLAENSFQSGLGRPPDVDRCLSNHQLRLE